MQVIQVQLLTLSICRLLFSLLMGYFAQHVNGPMNIRTQYLITFLREKLHTHKIEL